MRMMLAFVAIVYSTAALAQAGSPPAAAGKPPAQAKSKAEKKQPMAVRLQECLDIEDGTKERLNCYDAVIPPAPKPKAGAAKGVMDCKFAKEEDERLSCYNGFVESIPKLPKS